MKQLKFLAEKHNVKVKGSVVGDWGESYRTVPSKTKYVSALVKAVSEDNLDVELKEIPQVEKKRRKHRSEDEGWLF